MLTNYFAFLNGEKPNTAAIGNKRITPTGYIHRHADTYEPREKRERNCTLTCFQRMRAANLANEYIESGLSVVQTYKELFNAGLLTDHKKVSMTLGGFKFFNSKRKDYFDGGNDVKEANKILEFIKSRGGSINCLPSELFYMINPESKKKSNYVGVKTQKLLNQMEIEGFINVTRNGDGSFSYALKNKEDKSGTS